MKRALVCGAGGFIGGHLVARLKMEGYWVRAVDRKGPEFLFSIADEFLIEDLRKPSSCRKAMTCLGVGVDVVYQLAAEMGGMGYISTAECEIMRNSALINLNMIHAAAMYGAARYFFSSSVCVYEDMPLNAVMVHEDAALPALPDNKYGWEKLFTEQAIEAYSRKHPMEMRVGRLQNCYGLHGAWMGGREKAPAALCRKVAEYKFGHSPIVEVWGDGTAIRGYTFIDDAISGIRCLMDSDLHGPVNIGSVEQYSVKDLLEAIAEAAETSFPVRYVDGPVGVQSRNFSKARILSTGWEPKTSLYEGIALTYPWIEQQVRVHHECPSGVR